MVTPVHVISSLGGLLGFFCAERTSNQVHLQGQNFNFILYHLK